MLNNESRAAYAELAGRIDQQFPFTKLLRWASELKKANYRSPINQEELFQILKHITMHRMYIETILPEAGLGDRDIFVIQPSTHKRTEIHHGSYLFPDALLVLEDQSLTAILPELKNPIPRGAFSAAIDGAIITVGSMIVPHHLSLKDVNTVVKWHALKTAMSPLFKNDQEAVMCFYGGMKIIANRLRFGLI